MPDFDRILITGAAGALGSQLRTGLAHLAGRVRLVDVKPMGEAAAHERPDPASVAVRVVGGSFAATGHPDD